jgi:7-cyano-7-deazaguanine synthase
MSKIVMSLSGGMDSTTLLALLLSQGNEVHGVSFSYGSKHNPYENEAARAVAKHYNIPLTEIDLSSVMSSFKSNLLKSGGEIPEGHYTDKSMSKTVVPGRNIIFLSILSGLAWSINADSIAIGIHSGDHAIYPDCRPVFYDAMNEAISWGTDGAVHVIAPILCWDKTKILTWGLSNDVPYHLTRTCYKDQPLSCGKCGSCVERLEAFSNHGVTDPISYEV